MRYFFGFTANKLGQEGLSPAFLVFKNEATLGDLEAPALVEVSDGLYYCDYSPAVNVVFVLDGGSPALDVRTIFARFTPSDDGAAQILTAISDIDNDLIRALWTRVVINKSTGTFTVYETDGLTPLLTGTIAATESTVERTVS